MPTASAITLPLALTLALAVGLSACGDGTEGALPEDDGVTSTSSSAELDVDDQLPDLIDPESFADADVSSPPELPQLVGLHESAARRWAEASGFVLVNQEDSTEGDFSPTSRIVVETDEAGIVTRATAG